MRLIDGMGWSNGAWTMAREPNSISVLASHLLGLLSLFTRSQATAALWILNGLNFKLV